MKFLVFAILFFSQIVKADMPEYRVLENSNKSALQKMPNFKISKSKSDYRIEEISFGKKNFKLKIQDHFFNHEPVPFFEVTLKNSFNYKVFALLATTGTSGRSFHYFLHDGKNIRYSGNHPELFRDENGDYLSVEVDGPRKHVTTWQLKKNGFKSIKTEVVR